MLRGLECFQNDDTDFFVPEDGKIRKGSIRLSGLFTRQTRNQTFCTNSVEYWEDPILNSGNWKTTFENVFPRDDSSPSYSMECRWYIWKSYDRQIWGLEVGGRAYTGLSRGNHWVLRTQVRRFWILLLGRGSPSEVNPENVVNLPGTDGSLTGQGKSLILVEAKVTDFGS